MVYFLYLNFGSLIVNILLLLWWPENGKKQECVIPHDSLFPFCEDKVSVSLLIHFSVLLSKEDLVGAGGGGEEGVGEESLGNKYICLDNWLRYPLSILEWRYKLRIYGLSPPQSKNHGSRRWRGQGSIFVWPLYMYSVFDRIIQWLVLCSLQ